MTKKGYSRSSADHSLYYRFAKDSSQVLAAVYVDDIIFAAKTDGLIEEAKDETQG